MEELINDLKHNIKIITEHGKFLYDGEVFGMGKVGNVGLNYKARMALNDIRHILEIEPTLDEEICYEIKELLSGKVDENIFNRLQSIR